jgi:hypothetical protein
MFTLHAEGLKESTIPTCRDSHTTRIIKFWAHQEHIGRFESVGIP